VFTPQKKLLLIGMPLIVSAIAIDKSKMKRQQKMPERKLSGI